MGQPSRRRGLARAAVLASLLTALLPASAQAGWGTPFRFAQPVHLDITAPQLAISSGNTAAVAYAVQNEDNPAHSSAYVATRSAGGSRRSPRQVPSAQEVLDLTYSGSALELLTGTSESGQACCSSVSVRRQRGGEFSGAQRLARDLAGATAGRLVTLPGGVLAAVATERGVWVSQAPKSGRFGRVHLLTSGDARPQAIQAAPLPGGGSIVAWTETDRRSGSDGPRRIFTATGASNAAPAHARAVLSVPRGHRIDELGLAGPSAAGNTASPTLAWIEDWFDAHGNYRSELVVADVAHPTGRKRFAISGTIASGLTLVGDPAGDELAAWRTCTWKNVCAVREIVRRARTKFGAERRLGSIDASEVPAAALSARGNGLTGWVSNGHVLAASLRAGSTSFAKPHTVSRTNFASDIALSFGPSGRAIATWSQGTLAPDVLGAVYRP